VSSNKQPLINGKSETLTRPPTFKPHLQNRCLILADGFFKKASASSSPANRGLRWPACCNRAAGGQFTLLTTTPNASFSPYHHRMPSILRAEQLGA
jgi:putative SOS response-associated peptidase YedK